MKRLKKLKLFLILGSILSSGLIFVMMLVAILGAVSGGSSGKSNCSTDVEETTSTTSQTSSGNASIDEFVKQHEEAYIESWGVGGFLPSASIAQTMAEVSFSQSVPSFGQAHNMGGVKWTSAATYPKTIEKYGSDAVSGGGPGTNVGDNTGGGYTYFKDFDAGIVGKAEFMSRQTLYNKAINNTDGKGTLGAIADGGWATDPSYKTKLEGLYDTLGSKYKWLDEKAIAKYGDKPVDLSKNDASQASASSDSSRDADDDSSSCSSDDGEGAPDGSGTVPSDAKAWGYKPDQLPESLKPYILDPSKYGLDYGGPKGWLEHSGQCVDLTESLGNALWGHQGITSGNGDQQASAWASFFGNSTKSTPKKGAIFSTNVANNHTGIVCHVFEDGSFLGVEQNTPLSGASAGHIDTWNYRIFTPTEQKGTGIHFAYPDNKEMKGTK